MSHKAYPTAPPVPSGYPQQQPMYPQQYPQAQYPTSGYPYQQPYSTSAPYSAAPPPYSAAPPPYSQYPSQPGPPPAAPPPQALYHQQQVPHPQTVFAHNVYDAGARFDGVSQPRLPPPPPGVMPNAAQMAQMQGHTVVGTQQRAGWFSGSGDNGGYTFGGI